jgi:hypothetical protein
MHFSQFSSVEFKCTNYLWTLDQHIEYPELYSAEYRIQYHSFANSPEKLYQVLQGTRNPDFVYQKLKEFEEMGYGIEVVEPCYSRTRLHLILRKQVATP